MSCSGMEIELPLVCFVLLEDVDQTMRSRPEPIGFAVVNEREAKLWAESGPSRAYARVRVMGRIEDVLEERRIAAAERDRKFLRMLDLDAQIRQSRSAELAAQCVAALGGRPVPVRSPEEIEGVFRAIPAMQTPLEEPELSPEFEALVTAIHP